MALRAKRLKVGVVGVGNWGINHLRAFSELGEVRAVAVADTNIERLQLAQRLFGVKTYTCIEDLLDQSDVDALTIATPTRTHSELALQAIKAEKHVLVEKPLAASVKEAIRTIKEAERRNLTLMVGHIMRFNSGVNEIARLLRSSMIGKPLVASFRRLGMIFTRISDIGVVKDLAIHDIDLIRYLFSQEPIEVHAYAGKVRYPMEDHLTSLLKLQNGLYCFIEANWLSPSKVRQVIITGENGIIHFDDPARSIKIEKYTEEGRVEIHPQVRWSEPLKEELRHFARVSMGLEAPRVTGRDGLIALYIAEKMLESSREEKTVPLTYSWIDRVLG